MKKLIGFLVLAGLALFCWGWVSHVALGKMTTGQYVRKIGRDFRQFQTDLQEKIMGDTEKMIKTKDRIAKNVRAGAVPSSSEA